MTAIIAAVFDAIVFRCYCWLLLFDVVVAVVLGLVDRFAPCLATILRERVLIVYL